MNDDAVFKFDLQESLYFESGQEVAEMKGISLDPEIAIQDYDDYIAIRGVIELQGEYVKHDSPAEIRLDQELDTHAKRYVERVMDTEDDEASFLHRFPIEISVPSYRVTSLDDVYVHIDEFDYNLPDPHQLNFSSTISIHGIEDESESDDQTHQSNDYDSTFEEAIKPDLDTSEFEFTLRDPLRDPLKENDNKQEETGQAEESKSSQSDQEFLENEEKNSPAGNDSTESSEDNETDPETWDNEEKYQPEQNEQESQAELLGRSESQDEENEEQSKTLGEYFEKNHHSEDDLNKAEDHADSLDGDYGVPSESSDIGDHRDGLVSHVEGAIESDADDDVKDVKYLANMFASEEETYAKMILYIVQSEDTVENIAEKYDVNAERIMRHNHIAEEDEVSEGKLLYIPVTKE